MDVLIVLAHPERNSFNGALFDTAYETFASNGHQVQTSDLYRMNFDPCSGASNFTSRKNADYLKLQIEEIHASETGGFAVEIEQEMRKVEAADLIILRFPLWWFSLPAILKGWVDRVFATGRTYGNGRFYENGVFRGKRAMLSLTTGGPVEAYESGGFNGDMTSILRPNPPGHPAICRLRCSCSSHPLWTCPCRGCTAAAMAGGICQSPEED